MSAMRLVFLNGKLLCPDLYRFEMKNTGTSLIRVLKLEPDCDYQAGRDSIRVVAMADAEEEKPPVEILGEHDE